MDYTTLTSTEFANFSDMLSSDITPRSMSKELNITTSAIQKVFKSRADDHKSFVSVEDLATSNRYAEHTQGYAVQHLNNYTKSESPLTTRSSTTIELDADRDAIREVLRNYAAR